MQLEGKLVVFTGAATGIGRSGAHLFAREGASVVLADLNEPDGRSTTEEIIDTGGRAWFIRTDVSKAAEVEALTVTATETMGGIDVVVNNAGLQEAGAVGDFDEAEWDTLMAVNAKSCFLGAKFGIPYLRSRGGGAIINTASIAGIKGGAGLTAYAASKGAVIAFTKALAAELAQDHIRVNCICPGWIDTPFNKPAIDFMGGAAKRDNFILHKVPLGRQGAPEEVAGGMVFLASDASSYMTGQALIIDGGLV